MHGIAVLKLECIRFFSCCRTGRNLIRVLHLLIYCIMNALIVKNLDTDGMKHVPYFWKDAKFTET